MDKTLKNFALLSTVSIAFFLVMLIVFSYFYHYSSLNTYENLLLLIMTVITIFILLFIMSFTAVIRAYRCKSINSAFIWLVKLGLNTFLPFTLFVAGLFRVNKDFIRNFYINVNNIMVQSGINEKYEPGQVLVLVPHCLQNSDCTCKITQKIDNCKGCGKCCIMDIALIIRQAGVQAAVVTGGTAARKIVESNKPGLILSVACERDLMSGITDVGTIPVIGIINERPNGPCFNTKVDVNLFKQKLDKVIEN